jgi:hypothetical protein
VDAAEDEVRIVEPVERAHAVEQVVGHAVHHLADLAVDVGVQAAEVGHARRGAHAAEEAVALDHDRASAVARRAAAAAMPAGPPPSTTTSIHRKRAFAARFGDHLSRA